MQTSSPSYLLMSSLDAARHQAMQPSTWTEPIQAAMRICEGLCNLPGITLLEGLPGVCSSIPFHPSGKLLTALQCTASLAGLCCSKHTCWLVTGDGLRLRYCFAYRSSRKRSAEDHCSDRWAFADGLEGFGDPAAGACSDP